MDIGCKGWGYMAIGVRVSNLRMVKYTGSRRIGETNGRGRSYTARYSTERCVSKPMLRRSKYSIASYFKGPPFYSFVSFTVA
jgi:hypothetical protein